MIQRIKIAAWSCALFLVIGAAIAARAQWLGLLIPSAILVWYGILSQARRDAKAVRKPARIGLH
jgi:hypothetical protein